MKGGHTKTQLRLQRPRVLLYQSWWNDSVLRGVVRYAHQENWVLNCDMKWSHRWPASPSCYDGVIACGSEPALLEMIKRDHTPVVDLDPFLNLFDAPKVITPEEEIGRMAAEHLLGLNYKHLGLVEFSGHANPGGRLRFNEFREPTHESLPKKGFREAALRGGAEFHAIPLPRLVEGVAGLPRPMGLMAINDVLALDVLSLLLEAGALVPEEFAVIGVDDTELLCDFAPVPLSSINCDDELKGFEAAALLSRLIRGEKAKRKVFSIPPRGVTQRRSTDAQALPDLRAAKGLRFLRDHFREQIAVGDAAEAGGLPLWQLQKIFRESLRRSPIEELTRIRIEEAKLLLREKRKKILAVAQECGFNSRYHFSRTFTRIVGKTPAAYRRSLSEESV